MIYIHTFIAAAFLLGFGLYLGHVGIEDDKPFTIILGISNLVMGALLLSLIFIYSFTMTAHFWLEWIPQFISGEVW